jgi:hypothetical protein
MHPVLFKAYADACRFINDRERLRFALHETLRAFGVGQAQAEKIIAEVRAANFDTLKKTLKIKNRPSGHRNEYEIN